mmetsp:Transcript_167228/g.537159  ORF Transcript_167228/g.537159 Transcript_167228/m.537159 type:complete len:306 (+) Transcript_167228:1928-2845(+)
MELLSRLRGGCDHGHAALGAGVPVGAGGMRPAFGLGQLSLLASARAGMQLAVGPKPERALTTIPLQRVLRERLHRRAFHRGAGALLASPENAVQLDDDVVSVGAGTPPTADLSAGGVQTPAHGHVTGAGACLAIFARHVHGVDVAKSRFSRLVAQGPCSHPAAAQLNVGVRETHDGNEEAPTCGHVLDAARALLVLPHADTLHHGIRSRLQQPCVVRVAVWVGAIQSHLNHELPKQPGTGGASFKLPPQLETLLELSIDDYAEALPKFASPSSAAFRRHCLHHVPGRDGHVRHRLDEGSYSGGGP